jgi:hypothetical protein
MVEMDIRAARGEIERKKSEQDAEKEEEEEEVVNRL